MCGGAQRADGWQNGYGERTGNCNLITVIPLLQLKLKQKVLPEKSLPKLKELSEFVDEIANVRHDPRQPWVGQTAFAHKGGMHVHAIDRVARSYEHITPEAIGNQLRVLISDMAGRTNILMKAAELGFTLQPDPLHASPSAYLTLISWTRVMPAVAPTRRAGRHCFPNYRNIR